MPTRLLRWIRSKLSAITARTPRSSGPFAAQSRELPEPYSFRQHDEWNALDPIPLRCVEDRHPLLVREMRRPRPLRIGSKLVAQPHVRERASHHHLVVASTRAVAVELGLRYPRATRYSPAGESGLIAPAGEM
jgi:hypothetical protein